jgi:cell division protein FtsL
MSLKIDKEHTSVTKSEHEITPKPLLTSQFADVTAEKVIYCLYTSNVTILAF